MIRVGFIVGGANSEWIGGTNYIANLIHAINILPTPKIEPVLFVPPDASDEFLSNFPAIETIRTPIVSSQYKLNLIRKVAKVLLRRDYVMEWFLNSHRIDVLSHSGNLGPRAQLPAFQWIADFQHRRLPKFFTPEEIAHRDVWFSSICKFAPLIILSSCDAQRDLFDFDGRAVVKSKVLHFASGLLSAQNTLVSLDTLRDRYGFDGPYFHLPNQFWAHKNHRVVIEALALLKARGRRVIVLSTGHTGDRRNPDYFGELKELVRSNNIEDEFRVLGVVPYEDMIALMRSSVSVVNPSLFEGWSTTVEEAKSLGKTIILSGIPVHHEQAPEFGIFFEPGNAEALADVMCETLDGYNVSEDCARRKYAQEKLQQRFLEFAKNYEQIVVEFFEIKNFDE